MVKAKGARVGAGARAAPLVNEPVPGVPCALSGPRAVIGSLTRPVCRTVRYGILSVILPR